MKKSVYSLVLSDSVVEAVDRAAYLKGQSRSNFINNVLAEHLSFVTPEKRMRNIFDVLESIALNEEVFRIQKQQSDSMFSLLSSLSYKYRPTIRYQIELFPAADHGTIGELKIIYRTQSADFEHLMKTFFVLWAKREQAFVGNVFSKSPIKYGVAEGKLTRTIKFSAGKRISEGDIAKAISDYIQIFDRSLKEYIPYFPDEKYANRIIDKEYSKYLKQSTTLI